MDKMENSCSPLISSLKSVKACKCKYSKCLKLYCECFSSGDYCSDCNCTNCHNKPEHDVKPIQDLRTKKVKTILSRDPSAFRPKIPLDPQTLIFFPAPHFKGCNCKKTKCSKKYCECFSAGIACSEVCKCSHCKNKVVEELSPQRPTASLNKYLKVLAEGLGRKGESEEDRKSEESSTMSDVGGKGGEVGSYEKFEAGLYEKLIERLILVVEV